MPRYFFHLHNSFEAQDEEGIVLPNIQIAQELAVRSARELIAAEIKASGRLHLSHWLEIEDEIGQKTPGALQPLR